MGIETMANRNRRPDRNRLSSPASVVAPMLEQLEPRLLLSAGLADSALSERLGWDGDTSLYASLGDATPTGDSYMLVDHWGGSWQDAEKEPGSDDNADTGDDWGNLDDDLMCWAAAASNMLKWTNWGNVGGMTTADEMFTYFQNHWTDVGSLMEWGWEWWFDGSYSGPARSDWSQVDVAGGGFYPTLSFYDYFHKEADDTQALSAIDSYLRAGYGVTLGVYPDGQSGGHAITCWGFNYDSGSPTSYQGVWISDSDDDKSSSNPPDRLRYYEVQESGGKWYLQDFYGTDNWYIGMVQALEQQPGENHSPELTIAAVSPTVGTDATTFTYSVHYYDPDGDAPSVADLYIDGIRRPTSHTVGSAADGTYSYSTTLGGGTHNFFFSFQDGRGGFDMTPTYTGPTVIPEGETSAQFYFGGGGGVPMTEDFGVKYSVDGGPTHLILGSTLEYPGVFESFPTPCTLRLEGWTASDNHEFRSWAIYADGSLISETTAQIVNLSISTCDELTVVSYWGYTPQYYSLGGTITDTNGPVSGVEVSITGSAFTDTIITGASGTYSLSGVPGGVPYLIAAEHADYSFAPPNFSITNLTESASDYDFTAVNSDDENPVVTLVTTPEAYVNDTKHVSFAWSGSDNKTAPGIIEYRYRLLGSTGESWTGWSLGTTVDYDLPNGAYRFEVVAEDAAGNVSTFGDTYAFAVSASPRVTQAELIDSGIWLGTMDLSVSVGDTDPSDCVIIQTGQFGLVGDGFVPVRLLSADGQTAYGTIDYATEELGLPGIIEKTDVGFRVTLPTPMAAGETAEYLVQWGQNVNLGWSERNAVPYQAPTGLGENSNNYEYDLGSYLTTNGKHLRLRAGRHAMVPGNSATYNASIELHIYDMSLGSMRIEAIEFEAADYYPDGSSGYYGTAWSYNTCGTCFVETDTEIWVFWKRSRYTVSASDEGSDKGFGLRRFDKETMNPIGSAVYSPLTRGDSYYAPTLAPDGSVWLVGEAGDDLLVYSKVNPAGQIVAYRQTLATHPGGLTSPWFATRSPVAMPDGKVAFFYMRHWDASPTNSRTREQVYVKVLNPDGSVFLGETALSPAPVGPEIMSSDYRDFYGEAVVDQVGKVWVSFSSKGASGQHCYYSILNEDGTFFKNMVETPTALGFRFVDSDGFVWASGDGELFMLNADDTVAGGPYSGSPLTPNQEYDPGAASVGMGSCRLFDRWSSQVVPVDVGAGTRVGQMELIDIDEFGQGAHVQDLDVSTVGGSVITIPGVAPAVSYVDITSVLGIGTTGLMFAQVGLLGGEILVSFAPDLSLSPLDISVWDGNNEVVDGQTTSIDLGTVQQGNVGPSRTFTILNDGDEPLTLTVPFADQPHFIVGEPSQTTLNGGESTTFTVTLKTDTAWSGQETVSFGSNDADENPFDFVVSGTVTIYGDLNADSFVGQYDLDIVLDSWGDYVAPGSQADPSGDGFVGQYDLDIVLDHWGEGTSPGDAGTEQLIVSAQQALPMYTDTSLATGEESDGYTVFVVATSLFDGPAPVTKTLADDWSRRQQSWLAITPQARAAYEPAEGNRHYLDAQLIRWRHGAFAKSGIDADGLFDVLAHPLKVSPLA